MVALNSEPFKPGKYKLALEIRHKLARSCRQSYFLSNRCRHRDYRETSGQAISDWNISTYVVLQTEIQSSHLIWKVVIPLSNIPLPFQDGDEVTPEPSIPSPTYSSSSVDQTSGALYTGHQALGALEDEQVLIEKQLIKRLGKNSILINHLEWISLFNCLKKGEICHSTAL